MPGWPILSAGDPLLLCGHEDEMNISFQGSNAGVTAESIGAPPPVCAPKSVAAVDSFGNWQCAQTTGEGSSTSSSNLLLLAAAAGIGYYLYGKYGKHPRHRFGAHEAPQVEGQAQ